MHDVEMVFSRLAARQHGVAAVWQMIALGVARKAIDEWVRARRGSRIHRGVYGEPTQLGWLMAAVLAVGKGAAISHRSALGLWAMRDHPAGDVHVSAPGPGGRRGRDGIVVHRRHDLLRVRHENIPVSLPTQALLDARLPRYAAYRALEAAETQRLRVDWERLDTPALRQARAVLRLGLNPTRSDAEARFIFLCRDHGIEMPVVNHQLNGWEADFHWPRQRLVVEVDGWEHHREREQFESDRDRGLDHRLGGFEVVRFSARQVRRRPADVAAAVRAAL